MNPKKTFVWLGVAVALFAFIWFVPGHGRKPPPGPAYVLANFKAAAVTSVQVRRGAPLALSLRAERTNETWELTEPITYPAQAVSIDNLLAKLESLTAAAFISAAELRSHPRGDEDFGFAAPEVSLVVEQPDHNDHLVLGSRTAPGDQVFLQVVGREGIYVVDAELLKLIPHGTNDWRDTALVNLKDLAFDRLSVTNNSTAFALQRDPAAGGWRMTAPIPARANNVKMENLLQRLQSTRIVQFTTDDPKAELEPLGLQPPELQIALARGTNTVEVLQFGKSPTNDPQLVYARRPRQNSIVTVASDLPLAWRGSVNDFRDPHLLTLNRPVEEIEVHGRDTFSLQRLTNGAWRVSPQNLPADALLVQELLAELTQLQVAQFVQDVVTDPGLPAYGLALPPFQFFLRSAPTNAPFPTNTLIAQLDFGATNEDRIFARRPDESAVYAVKLADFTRLKTAAWQFRERQIWSLSENDVARASIKQQGRVRQIQRTGAYKWSLVAPSQGILDDVPVEETVKGLCRLAAVGWTAWGETNRAAYGFSEAGHQLTLELKNGEKLTVEFGGPAPSGNQYAAVTLEGQPWIFECPWPLYRDVQTYLAAPPNL